MCLSVVWSVFEIKYKSRREIENLKVNKSVSGNDCLEIVLWNFILGWIFCQFVVGLLFCLIQFNLNTHHMKSTLHVCETLECFIKC